MSDTFEDIEDIKKILPHRSPFLLIDRVIEIVKGPGDSLIGSKVVCLKNISASDPIFNGHFPEKAIFPGVLSIEAMAQAGAIFMKKHVKDAKTMIPMILSLKSARFRKLVVPGDQMIIHVELDKLKSNIYFISGKCFVADNLVAESIFTATVKQL